MPSTLPEARRSIDVSARLIMRARNALRRGNDLAAQGYLTEACQWADDACALMQSRGTDDEFAAWVAAVDRAIDSARGPWTREDRLWGRPYARR